MWILSNSISIEHNALKLVPTWKLEHVCTPFPNSQVARQDLSTQWVPVTMLNLNGDLQEEIYIEQPKGYEHPKYPSYVCKLQKTLYSLKTFLLEVSWWWCGEIW